MRLLLRRPDLAPLTVQALAADAWDAGALLSPIEVAEMVAGSMDRRERTRRVLADRRIST